MTSLSEANAKLAFDVFHLLSKDYPQENIMFSPLNLSTALGVLFHGLECDTDAMSEKEAHLNKVDDVSREASSQSEAATSTSSLRRRHRINLSKIPCAQAIVSKAKCEVVEGNSSSPISGENEKKTDSTLVASSGETVPQLDAEGDEAFYFIPWRSHFLKMDEPGNQPETQSSQDGKLSSTPAVPYVNQELSAHENEGEAPLAKTSSGVDVTPEKISVLLCEFKQIVKHADTNVQIFQESFGAFRECCDKMCISMSRLQIVLEALITVLRE